MMFHVAELALDGLTVVCVCVFALPTLEIECRITRDDDQPTKQSLGHTIRRPSPEPNSNFC